MRSGAIPRAIHDRTTFVILCNASMKRNGQPVTTDSLPYTYTYISGRKAKNDLHTTPKLTVGMPISCLLRSIQFPSEGDHLLHLCLFCMFSVEPRNKIVS